MTVEIDSRLPGTPMLRSFIETYRLITSKEELSGVTIANGRLDAVILLEGSLSYFDEMQEIFIEPPPAVFFPFTSSGQSRVSVEKGTRLINIKYYPHILTRQAFNSIETSGFLDFRSLFPEWEVERLRAELTMTESLDQGITLLDRFFEHYLIDEVDEGGLVSKVIEFLEQNDSDIISMAVLAKDQGVSMKTLERHFKRHTGLSTKTYRDLIRFQRAARQINEGGQYGHGDLLEALGSGYYDQSHFVKACRRITGVSPKELFMKLPGELTDFALL